MSTGEHKKDAPNRVTVGIITVSTTRTLQTDKSGQWMEKLAKKEGHNVVLHRVVTDDAPAIVNTIREAIQESRPQVLVLSGGTGISPKDVTIEAVKPLFEKELTGFSSVFAQLSFEEIDSAAILSRATAGVVGQTILFCIPGSLKACKLACKALIFPELGHLVKHLFET
jgi:molybdenum cofactor biosynthesis protein B